MYEIYVWWPELWTVLLLISKCGCFHLNLHNSFSSIFERCYFVSLTFQVDSISATFSLNELMNAIIYFRSNDNSIVKLFALTHTIINNLCAWHYMCREIKKTHNPNYCEQCYFVGIVWTTIEVVAGQNHKQAVSIVLMMVRWLCGFFLNWKPHTSKR